LGKKVEGNLEEQEDICYQRLSCLHIKHKFTAY
jgi:hypothetical protein